MRVLLLFAAGLFWPALAEAQLLTATDVQTIINQATTRALQISPNSVIAVLDREGDVLAVWSVNGTPPSALDISSCVVTPANEGAHQGKWGRADVIFERQLVLAAVVDVDLPEERLGVGFLLDCGRGHGELRRVNRLPVLVAAAGEGRRGEGEREKTGGEREQREGACVSTGEPHLL